VQERAVTRRRAGIRDVAAAAGVSPTTVSHVLNDAEGARVAEATRSRVRRAAERLGYTPSRTARNLRLQRTHTVGVISDRIVTTPYAGDMILGAHEAALRHGCILLLVHTDGDPEVEKREIDELAQHQVDGVLYASMRHRRVRHVPRALEAIPTVLVNVRSDDETVAAVVPDEVGGARAAVGELLEHGHTRVGFVNNAGDIPATHGRFEGYRAALAEAGVPYDPLLVTAEYPAEAAGGYRAAKRLLLARRRPTALFCFHDRMAMGAYRAAAELGLRVPHDLSVVGFDNQRFIADELHPGLTTVALPHYEMGGWGAETLLARIESNDAGAPPRRFPKLMPCPLVRRSSVAAPPA